MFSLFPCGNPLVSILGYRVAFLPDGNPVGWPCAGDKRHAFLLGPAPESFGKVPAARPKGFATNQDSARVVSNRAWIQFVNGHIASQRLIGGQ